MKTETGTSTCPICGKETAAIEELVGTLRKARGIIVVDAEACKAFRADDELPSGPENVLAQIDAVLRRSAAYLEQEGKR